jgi:hypothetical protein
MRRMMMLAMLPVLGGLFWAVACERDDYRDRLPLRPLDGAVASPDLGTSPAPPDLGRSLDMPAPPDMPPSDMPRADM